MMQCFYLQRAEDMSGISGTGRVAAGVIFPSGKVVMEWLVAPYLMTTASSLPDLLSVHGHGGATTVVFIDTLELVEVP